VTSVITSRPASPEDLLAIWDNDFKQSPDWPRAWRDASIQCNNAGMCQTFGIFDGAQAIGTGTLLFSPDCEAINGRTQLANNKTIANINALRINERIRRPRAYLKAGQVDRAIRARCGL